MFQSHLPTYIPTSFFGFILFTYTKPNRINRPKSPIPNQLITFGSHTKIKVVHTAPSTNAEILEFDPISKFAAMAASVINGAAHDAIYKPMAIYNESSITVLTMFPLNTGTIKQIKNGIVARSPKGNTVFPGRSTARNKVIGTMIKDADNTAGCPTDNALSIPMYKSLPEKR